MPGTLYLVATPIGNLDDMPPRVAATFAAADFVAAEDTRVTLRLLNHLGLKKPMVSYYEHALHHGAAILARIQAGEDCALCSDAGMPCISDPGAVLVRDALDAGKADAAVIDSVAANTIVKNYEGELKVLDEMVTEENYALAIAKGQEDLVEFVNQVIEKNIENGTIDKLLEEHTALSSEG